MTLKVKTSAGGSVNCPTLSLTYRAILKREKTGV